MKILHTKIIKIESDENVVTITFRPKGSDTADRPITITVTPHDDYLHLSFSGLGDKRITNAELGCNTANVLYGKK